MTDIGPNALREMCEAERLEIRDELARCINNDGPGDANFTNALLTVGNCRALLDRLSGEAVTREVVANVLWEAKCRYHVKHGFKETDEFFEPRMRLEQADAILSLLPAGMDRNAVIEDCAQLVDGLRRITKGGTPARATLATTARSIRAMRFS